jgi:hypothetical protein
MKDYSPERVATPEVRARHLTVRYLIALKRCKLQKFSLDSSTIKNAYDDDLGAAR